MDDQFRQEVLEVVAALAKSQQEKLAAAGTFVDIEELTAEVGDEVARQLANWELSRPVGSSLRTAEACLPRLRETVQHRTGSGTDHPAGTAG